MTNIRRNAFGTFSYKQLVTLLVLAIIIAGCSGNKKQDDNSGSATTQNTDNKNDLPPGGNKALLTLANGAQIQLDHASNGSIADQDGIEVNKTSDGQLEYRKHTSKAKVQGTPMNTLRTPKGGQYQVVLPDGTRVWLNAASSITYPLVSSGGNREIRLEGEAFFEVSKKADQPLRITVKDVSVEGSGPRFNINGYGDEQLVSVTLLQGTLLIREGIAIEDLKTNQQAQVTKQREINIVPVADTQSVTAWKNGFFNLDQHSLETNLRQIARWYDVIVAFEGAKPAVALTGKIERNITLSAMMDRLAKQGLKTRMEANRRLVVLE